MSESSSDSLFGCLDISTNPGEQNSETRSVFKANRGPQLNPHTIYGGELIAQALRAAISTVDPARKVISLHCYFHLPSDVSKSNLYEVEKMRDGRTFTHRLVYCRQNNDSPQPGYAFQLDCSFKTAEHDANSFTPSMPDCPHPEKLETLKHFIKNSPDRDRIGSHIKLFANYVHTICPLEFKPVDAEQVAGLKNADNGCSQVWMRLHPPKEVSTEEANRNYNKYRECFLAYMSDLFLLSTANIKRQNMGMVASLNHTMWFYNPWKTLDVKDWVLMDIQTQHVDSAIALVSATMWLEDGTILATMTQQGLLRSKKEKADSSAKQNDAS